MKPHDQELSDEEFSFTFNGHSSTNVPNFSGSAEICVGPPPTAGATTTASSSATTTTTAIVSIPNDCIEVPNVDKYEFDKANYYK